MSARRRMFITLCENNVILCETLALKWNICLGVRFNKKGFFVVGSPSGWNIIHKVYFIPMIIIWLFQKFNLDEY